MRREILHYLKSTEQSNISPWGTIGHPRWRSTDKCETILRRRGKEQAGLPGIPAETDSKTEGTMNVKHSPKAIPV